MHIKFAFFNIHLQVNVDELFKYLTYVFDIFFASFVIKKNIIEINLNKVIKIFKKNVIYVILIIDKLIREIKRQNMIFINFHESNKND